MISGLDSRAPGLSYELASWPTASPPLVLHNLHTLAGAYWVQVEIQISNHFEKYHIVHDVYAKGNTLV